MKRVTAILALFCLAFTLLAGCGKTADKGGYTVIVTDGENAPVPGVMLELCTEESCTLLSTDETGCVTYEGERRAYTVRLLKVPEGFTLPEETYALPAGGGLLTVVLR